MYPLIHTDSQAHAHFPAHTHTHTCKSKMDPVRFTQGHQALYLHLSHSTMLSTPLPAQPTPGTTNPSRIIPQVKDVPPDYT